MRRKNQAFLVVLVRLSPFCVLFGFLFMLDERVQWQTISQLQSCAFRFVTICYNQRQDRFPDCFQQKIYIYKSHEVNDMSTTAAIFMQSESNPSNDELPQDFTSRIINIIQNKQQERQEINLNTESEEDQEMYDQPQKEDKQSCKKSGKRDGKNIAESSKNGNNKNAYKKNKTNKYQSTKREILVDQAYDAMSEEQSSAHKKQPNSKRSETIGQQVLEGHRMLKDYFQDFLTKVLKKMQDDTNKILNQIIKKTDYLQQRIDSLTSEGKAKDLQSEQEYTVYEQKQKKHPYIKNWMKLNYVEKIERKQMTAKEVAKQLKIKQSVVLQWLSNKKKNKLKAGNQKGYKASIYGERKKKGNSQEMRNDNNGEIQSDFLEDIE